MAELVGAIILYSNGKEIDCSSVDPVETVGNKLVPTMNSSGRSNKSAKTIASGAIEIGVFISDEGDEENWSEIEDATITAQSLSGGHRKTWTGVNVETIGDTRRVEPRTMLTSSSSTAESTVMFGA